ncbi:MAG: SRPBCC family protein [Balneolaceae bacterium]|nr:SRPBCC family protein [Balneolaceae bacterium]MBO6546530.1 SRPBCC family protein [Balneolaceae bacterium]MBO6648889.1 SRPBCC family protein [Balneolaceae bacterium]
MKYSGSIEINKPKELVSQLFADPNLLHEYQDGFIRKELVKGKEGENGAVSKMYYKYGKHDMILTETVVSNNLPDSFEAFYHHKHMDNIWKCKFVYLGINKTRYEYEFEYVRMSFIPKLMSFLIPGMYRRQGEKWLRQFKEFVEKQ